jgi:ribosome biogenesis protein ERB1
MKIVRAIREGRIIPRRNAVVPGPQFYDLWGPSGGDAEESERKSNHPMHIPAPKVRLPDHSESYNPPPEYLLTEKERAEWEATDAEDRERNFVPAKHSSLRTVPGYNRFIQERFARCLDLYLCPRVKKNRVISSFLTSCIITQRSI